MAGTTRSARVLGTGNNIDLRARWRSGIGHRSRWTCRTDKPPHATSGSGPVVARVRMPADRAARAGEAAGPVMRTLDRRLAPSTPRWSPVGTTRLPRWIGPSSRTPRLPGVGNPSPPGSLLLGAVVSGRLVPGGQFLRRLVWPRGICFPALDCEYVAHQVRPLALCLTRTPGSPSARSPSLDLRQDRPPARGVRVAGAIARHDLFSALAAPTTA